MFWNGLQVTSKNLVQSSIGLVLETGSGEGSGDKTIASQLRPQQPRLQQPQRQKNQRPLQ